MIKILQETVTKNENEESKIYVTMEFYIIVLKTNLRKF